MPESNDSGSPSYQVICGPDACDQCVAMAGTYDSRPQVPVHPNCKCQVQEKKGVSVRYEVRNVECFVEDGITQEISYTAQNPTTVEQPFSLRASCMMVNEAFDEGVEDQCNWSPSCGMDEFVTMLPPRSETTFVGEVGYEGVICRGERWKIEQKEDGQEEETYVGDVGGQALACTGFQDVTVEDSTPL